MNEHIHYSWWPYIKSVVQAYPDREERPNLSGAALRELEAVRAAVEATRALPEGDRRMKAIGLLHWDRTHTLEGAALEICCGRATVVRWQRGFFEAVARALLIID